MKRILLLSLFCFMFFAFNAEAKVCEPNANCLMPALRDSIKNSKTIFSGKVISNEKEGDIRVVTFQVSRYWKGTIKRTMKVYYQENMRYQAWFETGKSYIVYAQANDAGKLFDSKCSATKNIEDAKADLKYLGKGRRPK